jgi:O-antigen/teichoic acid export membrane protein
MGGYGLEEFSITQQDSADDISASFTLSLLMSAVALIVLVGGAPLFVPYINPNLPIAYVLLCGYVVFTIPATYPTAILLKHLEFDKATIPQMVNDLFSIVASIAILFLLHFGVLSILIGQAIGFVISTIVCWSLIKDKPKFRIDTAVFKKGMHYAWPVSLRGLVNIIATRAEVFFLSKYYNVSESAFFNNANNLTENVYLLLAQLIGLSNPIMAKVKDDIEQLKKYFYLTVKLSSVVGFYFGMLFFAFAEPIVRILYGPQWIPSVPFLQVVGLAFTIRAAFGEAPAFLAMVRARTKYMLFWAVVFSVGKMTVGNWFIYHFGSIGAAYYYLYVFNFLLLVNGGYLIYTEFHSFEFLKHTASSVLAGLAAAFVGLFVSLSKSYIYLGLLFLLFSLVYIVVLLTTDKQLRGYSIRYVRRYPLFKQRFQN